MDSVDYLISDNVGKAMAEQFMNWVQQHPGGVVGVSARLPEAVLEAVGTCISESTVRTQDLTLVQCEELYPEMRFASSFKKWANVLKVDEKRCVTVDCSSLCALVPLHEQICVDGRIDFSLRWRKPTIYREDLAKTVPQQRKRAFMLDIQRKNRKGMISEVGKE